MLIQRLMQKIIGGGQYCGNTVILPEEITKIDDALVLINAKNPSIVQEIINEIKNISPKIEYLLADEFFCGKNAEIICNNIKILEDEKSKSVYEVLIGRRLCNNLRMHDLYEGDQYFAIPEFRCDDVNEVFVDMGGFVGDTLERYLFSKVGTFKKYFVFEPDEKNYNALVKRIARLNEEWNLDSDKIVPVFAGVGKENKMYYFKEAEKVGSACSHYTEENTGIERRVVSLDCYFKDIPVSFLKADIESYEFDMLQGAVDVLKRDKPKLAISIYHNVVDMYRILDWLADLDLGYKFYVRHHSVRDAETVLYAFV